MFEKDGTLHGTGHRPKDLGGYDVNAPMNAWLIETTREVLRILRDEFNFKRVITGMALGFDQWLLEAALMIGGYYTIAAVPCAGQEKMWPETSKRRYFELLEMCNEVHILAESYSPKAMQDRNIWMVDNSILSLAAWVGKKAGGTYNCLSYSTERGNEQLIMDPIMRAVVANAKFKEKYRSDLGGLLLSL
jgi:uncharacterized phage-like protein YoqJ